MPKMSPWHAPASSCYHDNSECIWGQEIAPEVREAGEGGKPLCRLCDSLNRAEERMEG